MGLRERLKLEELEGDSLLTGRSLPRKDDQAKDPIDLSIVIDEEDDNGIDH